MPRIMPHMRQRNHHLKRRGGSWYLRIRIPNDIRALAGPNRTASELEESLRTGDIDTARTRRDDRLAELKAKWNVARRLTRTKGADLMTQAYMAYLADRAAGLTEPGADPDTPRAFADFIEKLDREVERIYSPRGDVDALQRGREDYIRTTDRGRELERAIYIAQGKQTPIDVAAEEWLGTRPKLSPATLADYRTAFKLVRERFQTVEASASRQAKMFLADLLKTRARATVQKYTNAYRGLWEHLGLNPYIWTIKRMDSGVDAVRRQPWTDKDYLRLLEAAKPIDRKLWLAIQIAAYTGARASGIAGLRIDQGAKGRISLVLPETKSSSSHRVIPCPAPIVEVAREWAKDPYDQKALSKRFTRLKKKLGYPGSLVLHSFRHSVAGKLENKGLQDRVIKRVLGHKIQDITFGTYSAPGLNHENLKAAIDKIKWPKAL